MAVCRRQRRRRQAKARNGVSGVFSHALHSEAIGPYLRLGSAGGIQVGWAKILDAVLIAGLVVIAFGSAFVSALMTYPNPAHHQLLATIEQVFPR